MLDGGMNHEWANKVTLGIDVFRTQIQYWKLSSCRVFPLRSPLALLTFVSYNTSPDLSLRINNTILHNISLSCY